MSEHYGREALSAIDEVLADRPNKVGHDFSAATRRLAAWRDALAQRRLHSAAEVDRHVLERVNAAISVLLGGQFPLGQVPWPEIERVRQDLGDLVDQCSADAGSSSHTTRS
jgi:formate dehydrogenase major subunit